MGPLAGIRIVEIAGIGPGQFCGMLLADMGAELIRIERPQDSGAGSLIPPRYNLLNRSRPSVVLDLKSPASVEVVLALCENADALFEGFRPGVMERLGLGPQKCLARNPKLVYGRMTGWGQSGPLAMNAGHDGNYIARAGALHGIGEPGRLPVLPANLLGDFGGGGMYLAMGLLAALLEASHSGKGQVVDAAMVDGVASLTTLLHGMQAGGMWSDERGDDLLNGGAPFYRCYETADEKAVVVCALEPQFFAELVAKLDLDHFDPATQFEKETWPMMAEQFAARFASESRAYWTTLFEDSDACVSPVLSMAEARKDKTLAARDTFVEVDGIVQPAPAPRFSRTPAREPIPPVRAADRKNLLVAWGIDRSLVDELA
ncbi:MAG: CoA transferase [Woeseia sp.]|nr:CoA transferase [Woeseia sp.]